MSGKKFLWLMVAICCLSQTLSATFGQADDSFRMREVLELAEIGPARLSELPSASEFESRDWQLVLQVIARLEQFREVRHPETVHATTPDSWLDAAADSLGELYQIEGKVTSLESIKLPVALIPVSGKSQLFLCQLIFSKTDSAEPRTVNVLSSSVPRAWLAKSKFNEQVILRGVLLQAPSKTDAQPALLATDHIAWYPTEGAPSGQRLLARHGMDVALLDEVKHRQPFVKPTVSREGEAFYGCLKALQATDSQELRTLAQENVVRVAQAWKSKTPNLRTRHQKLAAQLSGAKEESERERLTREVRRAKTRRDLATTIARQAESNQSSVATMFLQPEREVGELFFFEGTARRAVWIAAEEEADLAGYFEVEVYPIEARLLDNRPIVCCFSSLPEDFPTGDQIRQPVQVAGIFFKSWRYRSRELNQQEGKTERPRQLYTPVLIGRAPTWLQQANPRDSRAAWWGGIVFLVALAATWAIMAGLSKRDRRARRELRPTATIDNEFIESSTGNSG